MTDHGRPKFYVSPGARPAAERWYERHGYGLPNWSLRDRAVGRFFPAFEARVLSPREAREAEAWRSAFLGPAPEWQRAVRFVRRRPALARILVWSRGVAVPFR